MEQLDDDVDKLLTEAHHLELALDSDDLSPQRVALALAAAKRVKRDATLVIRALAQLRDTLQAEEAPST